MGEDEPNNFKEDDKTMGNLRELVAENYFSRVQSLCNWMFAFAENPLPSHYLLPYLLFHNSVNLPFLFHQETG